MSMYKKFSEFDFRQYAMVSDFSVDEAIVLLAQMEMLIKCLWAEDDAEIIFENLLTIYRRGLCDDIVNEFVQTHGYDPKSIQVEPSGQILINTESALINKDIFINHIIKNTKYSFSREILESFFSGDYFTQKQKIYPEANKEIEADEEVKTKVSPEDKEIISARAQQLKKLEVYDKLALKNTKWTKRYPVIEDAIDWMADVLMLGCKCNHYILSEIAYRFGSDRNGEIFKELDEKHNFKLHSTFKDFAWALVPPERQFGNKDTYSSEECNCEISDHREMSKDIGKRRNEKESDPA